MTSHFTIEGKLFCFAGRLSRRTLKMYQRLVNRQGGRYTGTLTKKVDVLVIGSNPGKKLDQAVKWGIWVVKEFDFEMYIDHGLDITPPSHQTREENSLDTNALFGQLRAILDGSPDDSTWAQIIAVIDSTPSQELEVLTQYLLQHINRWEIDRWQHWSLEKHLAFVTSRQGDFGGVSMAPYHPRHALCSAPEHWINAMKMGLSQPHEALIQSMSWRGMDFTGTFAAKIISCEHLTNLSHLNAGDITLSKGFFTALRKAPFAPKLRTLKFTNMKGTYHRGIEGPHQLESLRDVTWWNSSYHSYDRDAVGPFFQAACFEQVQQFTCSGNAKSLADLSALVFPQLTQFSLSGYAYYFLNLNDWMDIPLLNDVKVIGLKSACFRFDRLIEALSDLQLTRRFEVLDISELYLWDDVVQVLDCLASGDFIKRFDAVYLGPFQEMSPCFEERGVSVCDQLPV